MTRPAGVSFGKDLGWRLEAFALDVMSAVVRRFPVSWVSGAGGRLLRLLGPLTRYQKLVERNLRLAFP
jgi:Kdo2-lipid IVA lauroyltransferase/acyltransferase